MRILTIVESKQRGRMVVVILPLFRSLLSDKKQEERL